MKDLETIKDEYAKSVGYSKWHDHSLGHLNHLVEFIYKEAIKTSPA